MTAALLGAVMPLALALRIFLKKVDKARAHERKGQSLIARPQGRLLWLHGASTGETAAYIRLIKALRSKNPSLNFLITSGTENSAYYLAQHLDCGHEQQPLAIHQFVPMDKAAWVRAFLNHWQPDAALFSDSDLWPNLLCETRRKAVPMLLLNAKISLRSMHRYQGFALPALHYLLGSFSCIIAQDEQQQNRLSSLGVDVYPKVYNLKALQSTFSSDADHKVETFARKAAEYGQSQQLWLGASTHAKEEELCLDAHQQILERYPHSCLVLLPRHPQRAQEILDLAQQKGLAVLYLQAYLDQRAQGEITQVVIVNEIGLLAKFYTIAATAYIGGSLNLGLGGHNLFEPARAGLSINHGPDMENQKGIAAQLQRINSAQIVEKAQDLSAAVLDCFANPLKAQEQGEKARLLCSDDQEQLAFFLQLITTLLEQKPDILNKVAS